MPRLAGEMYAIFAIYLICQVTGQPVNDACRYGHMTAIIRCCDLNLKTFPNFRRVESYAFHLDGNRFKSISVAAFPRHGIVELTLTRNDPLIKVNDDTFSNSMTSLQVLSLQNVDFDFKGIYTPILNLTNLVELTLGNNKYKSPRRLENVILPSRVASYLEMFVIIDSGVEDVRPPALNASFPHLAYLGFPKNLLEAIPSTVKRLLAPTTQRYVTKEGFTLDLSYNKFTTLRQTDFPKRCIATTLNVSYNQINCLRLNSLDNCQNLIRLDLRGNQLLRYLNPTLFTCKTPFMHVLVQNTSVQSLTFAHNGCIRSTFWNTLIPCDCELRAVYACKPDELDGDCIYYNHSRVNIKAMAFDWRLYGCSLKINDASPQMTGCGNPYLPWEAWVGCNDYPNSVTELENETEMSISTASRQGTVRPVSIAVLVIPIYFSVSTLP